MSLRGGPEPRASARLPDEAGEGRGDPASHAVHRRDPATERIDTLVRRVLAAGLALSAALLCAGFLVWAVGGGGMPSTVEGPVSAARSVAALEPVGFFSYGLFSLIMTPFARVAGTTVVFLRDRDWRFATVTALVLASMIAGFVVGAL